MHKKHRRDTSLAYYLFIMLIFPSTLWFLFYYVFQINSVDIVKSLIPDAISLLALMSGALFLVIQFTAERYSPRALSNVILRSPNIILVMLGYIICICFGLTLLGNRPIIGIDLGVSVFVSLQITLIILTLYVLIRLPSFLRPERVALALSAQLRSKRKQFLSIIAGYYRNDRVRYPRNIMSEDDYLIPILNMVEGALASHDLASLTAILGYLEELLGYYLLAPTMTQDEAVALAQYFGMHLTRLTEMIPASREDDFYQDIFRAQNLMIKTFSERGFFEAYKWCMITFYYTTMFTLQERSDYPVRIVLHSFSDLICWTSLYEENQFTLFLDLLNYISCQIYQQEVPKFQEPMDQWLMGMDTTSGAILSFHKQVCEKITESKNQILASTYVLKLLERFVVFENYFSYNLVKELTGNVLVSFDNVAQRTILEECVDTLLEKYPHRSERSHSDNKLPIKVQI